MSISKTKAGKNEHVVIKGEFSICVPEGMDYSTRRSEIGMDKELIFLLNPDNEFHGSMSNSDLVLSSNGNGANVFSHSEYEANPFIGPFVAVQALSINRRAWLFNDEKADISDPEIKGKVKEFLEQRWGQAGYKKHKYIKENDKVIVGYSYKEGEDEIHIAIVSQTSLYEGSAWINNVDVLSKKIEVVETWLKSVEGHEKGTPIKFKKPTYDKGRVIKVGGFEMPVPDGMMLNTDDVAKQFDPEPVVEAFMRDFEFIALPDDYTDSISDYNQASPYSLNIKAVDECPITDIFASTPAGTKSNVEKLISVSLAQQGRDDGEFIVECVKATKNCAIGFAQMGENLDPDMMFRSYTIIAFLDNDIYQGSAFFVCDGDKKEIEDSLRDWFNRWKY